MPLLSMQESVLLCISTLLDGGLRPRLHQTHPLPSSDAARLVCPLEPLPAASTREPLLEECAAARAASFVSRNESA